MWILSYRENLIRISASPCTFGVVRLLAACRETVKIQDRIEDEEVTALRLTAPHRITREQHDVPPIYGNVHHRRMLGYFVTAVEQTRDEKIAIIGVAQDHAWTKLRRNGVDSIAKLVRC